MNRHAQYILKPVLIHYSETFDLWPQRMKRQKDRQPTSLFCPGDTFSNRTCNIPYDEIPCPWRSVMPEQTSSRDFLLIFQPYAGMGTPANSAASLHKQEKKNRCVLNSIDFTSLHHAARRAGCSDVLSLSLCWQIRARDKEADRWKPTKESISDPEVLRARKAQVNVAKFSE